MDAFDSDVLIYAAEPGHPLGRRVESLFHSPSPQEPAGVGSTLLVPEILVKPRHLGRSDVLHALHLLLGRLDLRALDRPTANLATALGASYGLKAPDATHLATAVIAGADRFITNNRRDFPKSITEVDITYPEDLSDPG